MTRLVRFSNNAVSNLAANLTNVATSVSVTSGDGAKFPALSAGQYFMATLVKADGSTEVVKVTARSTDTLTIVRAAEPVAGASTAYAFSAGDRIEARLTAGVLSDEIDRLDNGAVVEALNKSANYTLVEADVTKLVRVTTTSGTTTITLPATSALTDDYDVIVAKVTSDANTVVIARTGSTDLINGATSYTIYNQWQSAWLIADRSTNTWTVISSGISAVNTVVDAGTGSGSASITLSGDPGSINNTALFIGGVYQQKSTYSISGTTLTAGGAIASGVGYEVVWSAPLTVGTPSDGTVTTAKLADGALAATVAGLAKMADGFLAATTAGRAKMADGFITPAKMQNGGAEFGMVNRIINGAMMIDQRNAGAAVTASGSFPVDRWIMIKSAAGGLSLQRSTQAPAGFTNSVGITVTSANTPAATDFAALRQGIEGLNISDLGWGSANAQTITLGFWVRSSVIGTFSWSLLNSAETRGYVSSFVISAANTWEFKTLTVPGDTSGTWLTDNGVGIRLQIELGTGTTYSTTAGSWQTFNFAYGLTGGTKLIANAGATFYITGVQLEKGSTATSFDYRPYGTELALCQRYFIKMAEQAVGAGAIFGTNNYYATVSFPVAMRASPTFAASAQNILQCFSNNAANTSSAINGGTMSTYSADIQVTATGTAGQGAFFRLASGYLQFSSEL